MNFWKGVNNLAINFRVISLIILSATTSSAIADNYYGAFDLGQSTVNDLCTGLSAGLSGCNDRASLMRFAGGYQFTSIWGAEASYGAYNKESLGSGYGVTADWQMKILQLSGTETVPITGVSGLSLIAKFGIAHIEYKSSGAAFIGGSYRATRDQAALGLGFQYDLTKNISARAQYEDLGNVGDSKMGTYKATQLSAGIVYKF